MEKDANFRGNVAKGTEAYLNTKRLLPLDRFIPPEPKNP